MRDASFSWGDDNTCLSLLNIDIKAGQLIGIIGSVGAGKSALLAAILGEMNQTNGVIKVYGSRTYVAQSSWIFPDTIRANILLGKPLDMERYMRILCACCLDIDLSALGQVGDLTMIGERGINLSEGQKARVSLARALYIDADIYLLDDPFAAVDATVAKKIYDASIGPQGLLSEKTRLLVTHQTHILTDSHQNIVLVDGRIEVQGPLNQLPIQYKYGGQTKGPITTDKKHDNTSPTSSSEFDLHKAVADTKSIVCDEISSSGSVSWTVWLRLFTASPLGWFGLCLLIVLLLLGEVIFHSSFFLLASWSHKPFEAQQRTHTTAYIYLSLILFTLIIGLLRASFWFYLMLCGTNSLHKSMLKGIVYTSIRFFESNPSGRILNRASRDQQIVDDLVPETMLEAIQALLMTVGCAIIICLYNKCILLLFITLTFIFCCSYRFYARTSRQLKRLESVSRSPVYTLFSSSLNGLMTIRACKVKEDLIQRFADCTDANTRAYLIMKGAVHWFGLRLDIMAALFSLLTVLLYIGISGGPASQI